MRTEYLAGRWYFRLESPNGEASVAVRWNQGSVHRGKSGLSDGPGPVSEVWSLLHHPFSASTWLVPESLKIVLTVPLFSSRCI